jgi:hypothetical protein
MELREKPGGQLNLFYGGGERARCHLPVFSLGSVYSGKCEYVTGFPASPGLYAPAAQLEAGKWKGAY